MAAQAAAHKAREFRELEGFVEEGDQKILVTRSY